MPVLSALLDAARSGAVRVVDLTTPLQESTPILELPPPFANTSRFRLEELSRYDEKGPAWYWNDIHTGEHTGTHLDAPNHWVTGRDGLDVSRAPLSTLVAPVVVIDKTAEAEKDADFLLQIADVEAWQAEHGPLPEGGWLLHRTGWSSRGEDAAAFANADENGPHTPGVAPDCARWLARETPISGFGVETVGTDAGQAPGLDPAFPCHSELMGAGKWGLTSLRNLDQLPATGAVLVVCPLPIVGGSGSPARVLALVED
ncbi:MAG: cyclase family protein [Pseudonocardia sp.]|uniref:cyclase family protein n=1 Tax=unclassified Pseudonocardia TaxID=2619320 RepID=UPI00086A7334|nr:MULTISPECIES: cyclase family protein [unclassified Pseudonocardia]MBN9111999.1 cyclase family protein [Pseudonocardia sp.]ODU25974.1 MAG: cyclase [Pseudonocardia sp. SCN 72-51]ODV06071.1 MAG: cyclase [Pseudonocardia sp. SCN 73-27]